MNLLCENDSKTVTNKDLSPCFHFIFRSAFSSVFGFRAMETDAVVANFMLLLHYCDYVQKYENTVKTSSEQRKTSSCLHFVQPQQSNSANKPWQMWSDGIMDPSKLGNVLLPLVSVWTINQPCPLQTMSLLVREERCSGRMRRASQHK